MLVAGCDESQALHEPHPSLERMQIQGRVDPFGPIAMAAPAYDTVAREDEPDGLDDGARPTLDAALLTEGRDHFDRICAACHGVLGDGKSVVATKMVAHPPTPFVEDDGTSSAAAIYRVERDGKGWMPAFAHELTPRERWATAYYVQALRLSRHAIVADLPPALQAELRKEAAR
jgi:mono/diheme cytochrome c family protein